MFSCVLDVLLGRKRATHEMGKEMVGVFRGVPMLGLDALSSAAYGPEAALTIMIGLGIAATNYILPIFIVILILLGILYVSYLQTIEAYPNGGGSYTVAGENLGPKMGLLAAAALLLDYILTVAVGISAGIGAIISAVPELKPYTLPLCLAVLVLILVVNLRGIKESGEYFALPTYLFVLTLFIVIGAGIYKTVIAGGHPQPLVPPPPAQPAIEAVGWWLIVRAFASGCTAMTGVEAVSNGIIVFAEPKVQNAQRTLTAICVILGLLLFGVAFLSLHYPIVATVPDTPQYESVLSQIVGAVMGKGWFYYVTIASILAVLCLSANTGFADFPRLCRLLGRDMYLPLAFQDLSRRLVFSVGILVLTAFSAVLLIIFHGVTDRLIPLFAVGAFTAFTLSQAGMVVHWRKHREVRHAKFSLLVNALGCVSTGIATAVIFAAKFAEGAWISLLIIAIFYALFIVIHRHYSAVLRKIAFDKPLVLGPVEEPLVVMTINHWNRIAAEALEFALGISDEVHVLHVSTSEEETATLKKQWENYVVEPMERAHRRKLPPLTVVASPYRERKEPLIQFVNHLKSVHKGRYLAVVIPELVAVRWYSLILHRQWGTRIKKALLEDGKQGVVVVSVPWRLRR